MSNPVGWRATATVALDGTRACGGNGVAYPSNSGPLRRITMRVVKGPFPAMIA